MKDFNIAKYLKEHNLGSHGILGKYVDLQALKEEEAGLGQQKAMKEPYEGPKDPIDGLGGKLDRDMDVSMNEMDYDMDGEENVENAWMEYVDGTEAYKVGNWTCYYDHPGILVWLYKDVPPSKLAVYATPNWDGDETTPIQIEVNDDVRDNMTLRQAEFANFNEYAKAMKPYLDQTEDLEYDWGVLAPTDEAKVQEAEEIDMNEYDQLLGAIENLLRQGEKAQNILQVVKDTLGMNEAMDFDGEESESGKHDRMMGLIDRTLESQLGKVKKVIDAARNRGLRDMAIFKMLSTWDLTMQSVQDLVNDGFEAQDIVDFFATDFSMQEDDINLADLDA